MRQVLKVLIEFPKGWVDGATTTETPGISTPTKQACSDQPFSENCNYDSMVLGSKFRSKDQTTKMCFQSHALDYVAKEDLIVYWLYSQHVTPS